METISSIFDGRLVSCQDLPPKATIFGLSEGMKGLWQIVERVASASVPVLILGEKGTGKEVLARFIHSCSPGHAAPFLKLIQHSPDGHNGDEVAFRLGSGGLDSHEEPGNNGNSSHRVCTLFIEEVTDLPQDRQHELLKLIQGCKPFISNGCADIPVTLRVIGASSHDLEQEVAAGRFREDLFSLLSVVTLRLPPLRDRREDVPQLANHFWHIYRERFGSQAAPPSAGLIEHLQQHDWPGNIRELESVMKRYVVLGAEGITGVTNSGRDQRLHSSDNNTPRVSLKEMTRQAAHALERKIILRTLQETQWNRRRTARALNISYRALLYKIKEAGLIAEQPRTPAGGSTSASPTSGNKVSETEG
ncbi:MAG TPA: sigma 54-interacting transcriptional regulator [Terriglobia bacterium]|nr:sigma 54-interacting transcriptional regulator [Terriglobia bacterium]